MVQIGNKLSNLNMAHRAMQISISFSSPSNGKEKFRKILIINSPYLACADGTEGKHHAPYLLSFGHLLFRLLEKTGY